MDHVHTFTPPHPASAEGVVRVFRSQHHPHDDPPALVFARAIIRPLALCMLPVMIVTLVVVLQGLAVTVPAGIGAPVAVLLASAWTAFRLRATVAELMVAPECAIYRTVWECATDRPRPPLQPLLEVRREPTGTYVALGTESLRLDDEDWPDALRMLDALTAARRLA